MQDKILNLRALFPTYNIDGYIIPSSDEFNNEYLPKHLKRLKWLTGFTGSNGLCIITDKFKAFFTDGRYLIQAETELGDDYQIFNMTNEDYTKFFTLIEGSKLGFDPNLLTKSAYDHYCSLAKKLNIELILLTKNLIDEIWLDKPLPKKSNIIELGLEFVGLSREEKIKQVLENFSGCADYLLLISLDSICWLLNIRADDISYTPFLLSYLIMDKEGNLELFLDQNNQDFQLKNVKVRTFKELKPYYLKLVNSNKKIALDLTSCSYWFFANAKREQIMSVSDPCQMLKACKNKVEIKGFRDGHIEDGTALCKFLFWLEQNIDNGINEVSAAKKLLELRKERKYFQYPSFGSISAFKQNGAIIHYHPTPRTCLKLTRGGLYLIDSGGQYLNCTTDVTRITCFGEASQEQTTNFTLVLKGFITLSKAVFPVSATGLQLDALARYPLWQHGLNYPHGTGHGVGHFLSVHEKPNNISPAKHSYVALKPGMITSIEPGFYKQGEYGIRIENLALVKESEYPGFLEFESLTLAPIESKLINVNLLDEGEKTWLNHYHEKVYNNIAPHLNQEEKKWLKDKTYPL
ncbi:aminopeptidase P family protein [Holosporaceae bacterium 'Namur']|nr:aminopeptidase P family protein [Holosporaceae bacterium 'Namur']